LRPITFCRPFVGFTTYILLKPGKTLILSNDLFGKWPETKASSRCLLLKPRKEMSMRLLLILLFTPVLLLAQDSKTQPIVQDGPYLLLEEQQVKALWIEAKQLKSRTFQLGQAIEIPKAIAPDFSVHFEDLETPIVPQTEIHFETEAPVAALSDVHGQYDVMVKLLQVHRIIDQDNNWIFGNGHLVIVGDVFDRGDQVTEILWLIHKLEKQATNNRGRVHFLLGNHELMVLTGDLRFLHPKYRYTMALTQRPLQELFNTQSYLGRWLRSKPLAITINDMAFVHGGFSELLLDQADELRTINELGRKSIDAHPEELAQDSLLQFMASEDGPLWYRGYFKDPDMSRRQAERILDKLQVNHIIVGHTSHEAILPLFNNRIIGVDSSIKFGKSGEILIREQDQFYRGSIFGERTKL
jgi:hypothetical protein